MRCDIVLELLDDLEHGRLPPLAEIEMRGHLASCSDCAGALSRYRGLTGELARMSKPSLPEGFEAALSERLRASTEQSLWERFPGLAGLLRVSLGYAATAAIAVALTILSMDESSSRYIPQESIATDLTTQDFFLESSIETGDFGRSCNAGSLAVEGLHVRTGEEVAVTLSVQAPKSEEGSKVYLLLPKGLSFSPTDHPTLKGKRVVSFRQEIAEGADDVGFTVQGTKVGRWDVVALVEDGDSIQLAGTTIVVAPEEAQL